MAFFNPLQPVRRVQAACGCNTGKRRKNNEDNFYFDGKYLDSENGGLAEILVKEGGRRSFLDGMLGESPYEFYAVFDGMGGGDYGEVASNLAAITAEGCIKSGEKISLYDVSVSLQELCREMSRRIFQSGTNLGAAQMGSTITSLFFYAGQVWVCNVGDSRCYRLRNRKMEQLSVDHTDEEEMKIAGITGRKPYLTQYLGVDPSEMRIEPYVKRHELKRGDRFLLCSDGLTDMVSEQEICDMLAKYEDPEECTERLIQAALDGGGKDNITVIVYQN